MSVEMTVSEVESLIRPLIESIHNDFTLALRLIVSYQRSLSVMSAPDPNILAANALLKKYGQTPYGATQNFRVYVDGYDITEHPEREATAEEILPAELESGNSD